FLLYDSPALRDLHSFPTRRSSDLQTERRREVSEHRAGCVSAEERRERWPRQLRSRNNGLTTNPPRTSRTPASTATLPAPNSTGSTTSRSSAPESKAPDWCSAW